MPRQTPIFEEFTAASAQRRTAIYKQRGDEYGDTWRNCQFLIAKAVAKKLGFNIPHDHLRAIVTAGFCDMKYQRFEGGFKYDHLEDGPNYQDFLNEAMRRIEADK